MTAYRDDKEALRARVRQLEDQVQRLRSDRMQSIRTEKGAAHARTQKILTAIVASIGTLVAFACGLGMLTTGYAGGHPISTELLDQQPAHRQVEVTVRVAPRTIRYLDHGGWVAPVVGAERTVVLVRDWYDRDFVAELEAGEPTEVLGSVDVVDPMDPYAPGGLDPAELDALGAQLGAGDLAGWRILEAREPPSFWPFQLLLAQTVLGVLFLWLALLFQMRDREAAMPEERDFGELDPTLTVFLIVITCGLFGVYWHWRLTGGLGRLTGRVDLIPWLDLLMVFATFGLWNFWAQYRNASALEEALDERGRHDALRGAVATAWVLSLFCGPAALFVPWKLQDAYNELVRDLTPPI
ncbi:MAG TPA: hypothetical protein RMH85_04130 [Polyangiaceae bacterium LLY-WYZ-15_(1-7)]|nr:hypothetical protein [Myxococcales bacterium]MBJ70924.1 hypothetical protein [Sandaracinus sp.]HJL03920.1 hypothetical protein [Polyangiaceae bacterium LLY-WYZ-15_(1-7)]HJL07656.1 hypothetical protein [Polyangiaceae bacterium LLY-WYZ-15_(1-7)]HJL32972.1 hypothetical protein [Polyangiaceae bacterium LLY-WYZ-15_(1-7)]